MSLIKKVFFVIFITSCNVSAIFSNTRGTPMNLQVKLKTHMYNCTMYMIICGANLSIIKYKPLSWMLHVDHMHLHSYVFVNWVDFVIIYNNNDIMWIIQVLLASYWVGCASLKVSMRDPWRASLSANLFKSTSDVFVYVLLLMFFYLFCFQIGSNQTVAPWCIVR